MTLGEVLWVFAQESISDQLFRTKKERVRPRASSLPHA